MGEMRQRRDNTDFAEATELSVSKIEVVLFTVGDDGKVFVVTSSLRSLVL